MKYAMFGGEPRDEDSRVSPEEMQARIRCHQQALNDLLRARVIGGRTGLIFASIGLGPFHGGPKRTLTVGNRDGRHFRTDGPFPETKEVVGGFDLIDFDSREEAIEFAKTKNVHDAHVAEIRPVREFWWISHTPSVSPGSIFMLSLVEQERAARSLPPDELKKAIRKHQAVGAEYVNQCSMVTGKPGLWFGMRLAPSTEAITIRRSDGKPRLIDGPFAETREVVGGINLVACDSFEEAAGWAEKLAATPGETIEIRPVDGFWWIYHE
jgi:hypothetical protein